METSRGCPYHCTFCAKDNFRNCFRRRPLAVIAEELDGLVAQGVEYVYFIDEIFLPYQDVLELIRAARHQIRHPDAHRSLERRDDSPAWASRVRFDRSGRGKHHGSGRARLDKKCRISTEEISRRLILAKERRDSVRAGRICWIRRTTIRRN